MADQIDLTRSLPLGRAPRPTTGADLLERLQVSLADSLPSGIEPRTVEADLSGADVTRLFVDLTGTELVEGDEDEPTAAAHTSPAPVTVAEREPGIVRELRVLAAPATARGVPITVDAALLDLRFDWVTTTSGDLVVSEADDDAAVRGHGRVAFPRDLAITEVRRYVVDESARAGIRIPRSDLQLEQAGRNAVTVRGNVKVRKGVLGASAQVKARVEIDDHLVLRVTTFSLRSRNPLIAAVLVVARGRIRQAVMAPQDLGADLRADGVHVTDLQVVVGSEVSISARFTDTGQ